MGWLDDYIKQQSSAPSEYDVNPSILQALTNPQYQPPPKQSGLLDKLLQTWPARMAQSAWNAATLPGDVWNGKVDPLSEEGIGRATDLAGLTMSSTLASPRGSIGVGPVLPKKGLMAVEPPTPMTMTPPQGIRAYHGSPHDFDKFDISKIGTGEGAQSYGHGLYFAENEGVAKAYRDQLAGDFFKTPSGSLFDPTTLQHMNTRATLTRTKDLEAAIKRGLDILPTAPPATKGMLESDLAILQELKNQGGLNQAPGRMYEVNINARPDQFLDWDKPLREQPVAETVRSLVPPDLRKSFDYNVDKGGIQGANAYMNYVPSQSFPIRDAINSPWRGSGAKTYEEALALVGGDPKLVNRMLTPNHGAASQNLFDAGVPGIRYLDQGSRNEGKGTFNYVVFNDALIDILRKYGLAGATATGVAASAANAPSGDVY